jgi:hypothetical protein
LRFFNCPKKKIAADFTRCHANGLRVFPVTKSNKQVKPVPRSVPRNSKEFYGTSNVFHAWLTHNLSLRIPIISEGTPPRGFHKGGNLGKG